MLHTESVIPVYNDLYFSYDFCNSLIKCEISNAVEQSLDFLTGLDAFR